MAKSATELIEELKQARLTTFWITREKDVPWLDKVTLVSQSQQAEILDLTIKNLKDQNVLKVEEDPSGKLHVTGFCKPDPVSDLSGSFYDYMLKHRNEDTDFIIYTVDGKYAGACVLRTAQTQKHKYWNIRIDFLCSVKQGTGTTIITMIKEAVKMGGKNSYIVLSPLDTVVDYYKKLGFTVSEMAWYDEELPTKAGKRKNGLLTRKLKHKKNAKVTSRNSTKKSRKLV